MLARVVRLVRRGQVLLLEDVRARRLLPREPRALRRGAVAVLRAADAGAHAAARNVEGAGRCLGPERWGSAYVGFGLAWHELSLL